MELIKHRLPNEAGQLSIGIEKASLWKNENHATKPNSLNATTTPKGVSHYLHLRNFNFKLHHNDIVTGIEVRISRSGNGISDNYIGLVLPDGDTIKISHNLGKKEKWEGEEAFYGSPTELWGENTITASQVNDPDFGVGISVKDPTSSNVAKINFVEITVRVASRSTESGVITSGDGLISKIGTALTGNVEAVVSGESKVEVVADIEGGSEASGVANHSSVFNETGYITGKNSVSTEYGDFSIEFHLKGKEFFWNIKSNSPVEFINIRRFGGKVRIPVLVNSERNNGVVSGSFSIEEYWIDEFLTGQWYVVFKPVKMPNNIGRGKFGGTEHGIKFKIEPSSPVMSGSANSNTEFFAECSGGSVLSSRSKVEKTLPGHGGVVTQPKCDITSSTSLLSSGGINCNGTSFVSGPYYEEISGGACLCGESSVNVIYNAKSNICNIASGNCDIEFFYCGNGGSKVSGSASHNLEFNISPTGSVNLLPDSIVKPYQPIISGGLESGGNSIVTPYYESGSGGIALAGDQSQFMTFSIEENRKSISFKRKSSTLDASFELRDGVLKWNIHHDTNLKALNIQNSMGGVVVYIGMESGLRNQIQGQKELRPDQIEDFNENLMFLYARYEEERRIEQFRERIKSPKIVLGGSCQISHNFESCGGMKTDGDCGDYSVFNHIAETEHLSAQSFASATESSVNMVKTPTVSGGSSCSGEAVIQAISNPAVSHGSKASGSSLINAIYNSKSSGETKINGKSSVGISPAISGGISLGGETTSQRICVPECDGGIISGGEQKLQLIYEAFQPGQIQFNILSFISALSVYSESGASGIKLGGRGKVERLRTLTPSKVGWSLSDLKSDHIYKEEEEAINPSIEPAVVTPTEFVDDVVFYDKLPLWREFGEMEKENSAALPEVVIERQNPYVPAKQRSVTARDRTIARI